MALADVPASGLLKLSTRQMLEAHFKERVKGVESRYIPDYVQETLDKCSKLCEKAHGAIRNAINQDQAKRLPSNSFENVSIFTVEYVELTEYVANLFEEKYGFKILLTQKSTTPVKDPYKLTEAEKHLSKNVSSSTTQYFFSTSFKWDPEDPVIFPERALHTKTFVKDPASLVDILWNMRDATGEVLFRVGEEAIKAHSCVLAARCAHLINPALMAEAEAGKFSAAVYLHCIHFAYHQELPPKLTLTEILDVRGSAIKWGDKQLEACATDALFGWLDANRLSKENLKTWCDVALLLSHQKLKTFIVNFVEREKAWDAFAPSVTLDNVKKWRKMTNEVNHPDLFKLLTEKSIALLEELRKATKAAKAPKTNQLPVAP